MVKKYIKQGADKDSQDENGVISYTDSTIVLLIFATQQFQGCRLGRTYWTRSLIL